MRAEWASLRLDVGRTDHLAPLLGIVDDELAEVGGRARKRLHAQFDEPRFERRISEGGVNLRVEDCDDLLRRVSRGANSIPPVAS